MPAQYLMVDKTVMKAITQTKPYQKLRMSTFTMPASLLQHKKGLLAAFMLLMGSLWSTDSAIAQNATISGVIRAKTSGETLIGATVAIPVLKKGTYTDTYGFFSLTLPVSDDSVEVKIIVNGYNTESRKLVLNKDIRLDVELTELSLDQVEITANSVTEELNSTQMSVSRITVAEAKKLPALFGEVDIIKTLQLKPGVSAGSEGNSGIYVRGGGPDQNLILLDNTVLYNPSHLFGFFSTFNSDAVKTAEIYKGGFPSQYGGRLSSVIDVKLNEGNRRKFSAAGGLGLIASRLTVEGPIVKDKASFMISGRRTYADIITRGINQLNEDNPDFNPIPDYFFYDLNGKINYELGEKDQLFLSGYFGQDRFEFAGGSFNFNFDWGNTNANLRWNHFFNPKFYMNTSLSFTDYEYSIRNRFDDFSFELGSKISDGALRTDFTWLPNAQHTVRFGVSGIHHRFVVGRLEASNGEDDGPFNFDFGDNYYAMEWGAYIADDIEVNEKLKINLGLRVSAFQDFTWLYQDPNPRVDSTFYGFLEPRASVKYSLTENISWKASYARMAQYLHLVANSGTTLPTDIWYPSTRRVNPQSSDQIATGISIGIGEQFLLTNEVYYKWLNNQVDFKDGANLFVNDDLESEFVFGRGWAYGNEFYIEKTRGQLTGWIGYSLAWSRRQFADSMRNGDVDLTNVINDGDPFFARNDKRHDISVVAIYSLPRTWTGYLRNKIGWPFKKLKEMSVSGAWDFRSGAAYTLAPGFIPSFGEGFISTLTGQGSTPGGNGAPISFIPDFTNRNNARLPDYHKLDLALTLSFKPKWGETELIISAYNAYNRRNAFFVFIDTRENDDGVATGFQGRLVSLFPLIPSFSWNFKF
ncbi:MAG: TonB-dependent receptor [Bacteroidota bacterium]